MIANILALMISLPALATEPAVDASYDRGKDSAEYEVPTGPELAAFNKYEIKNYSFKQSGREVEIAYLLPLDLTGAVNREKFRGEMDASGLAIIENENGKITCSVNQKSCFVKYQKLDIDAAKARKILEAKGLSISDIASRLEVTARFGGDLEGILRFPDLEKEDQ